MKKLRSANICKMAKFLIDMEDSRKTNKQKLSTFSLKNSGGNSNHYIYNYLVVIVF